MNGLVAGHNLFVSALLPFLLLRKAVRQRTSTHAPFIPTLNGVPLERGASRLEAKDPRSGIVRRHHLDESGLQKAVKLAGRMANIDKRVSCHTFRHSFATQLLQNHYDIRTVQELLGHKDVKTTMIYTHVLNKGGRGVRSPLDACA